MARSSNTALLIAALLLFAGMSNGVARAQKSSCGDAASAQSPSSSSSSSSKSDCDGADNGCKSASDAGKCGTAAAATDAGKGKPDSAKGKGGSSKPSDGAAKTEAAGCSAAKNQPGAKGLPGADAPTPSATAGSQAAQFAFPEDISRKAAQAAASGLPDNPASGVPDNAVPNGSAAGGSANPGTASTPPPGWSGPAAGPSSGGAQGGGNPFPMPTGKAASTPGWGGLRRRSTDPNDPYGSTPADPSSPADSSSSSSAGSSSSESSGSGAGSNGPPAHDSPGLQLEDAGSSGQMVDSYRAENDDDVADFYNKNGNYQGAYMRYQDAVHFNPDDEPAQYGLAEMAQKLGHTQEAIEHYQAYLKMAPSGDRAKDAARALKRLGVSSPK